MNSFAQKIFLKAIPPSEDMPISDQRRIVSELDNLGFSPVQIPLKTLRKLYPLCREEDFTLTLVSDGHKWIITDAESGNTSHSLYGLAVDYGSTTIVMQLVDLNSGAVIHQEKAVNGQTVYGTDILTRITYSLEAPSHSDDLQRVTAETFSLLFDLITEQTGIDASRCPVMMLSGNTTMIHFLLKLNAWTVFASPYAPVTSDPGCFRASDLGMDFEGLVHIIPAASNYIGGDIVSGVIALGIHQSDETQMFFDIGTNGELVLGCRDWMIAGAGAAGPALEGYISRYGMRAAEGAVDRVAINGPDLAFTTISGTPPKGICGSGIIDLIAQMRLNGWINIAGELNPSASERIVFLEDEHQYAAVYAQASESASGEPLFFTQTDIDQYLDTKAAAATMIECIMETAGISGDDVERLFLSGAFTAHSDLESAVTIGIFPDLPRQRYTCIANTSLDGARKILLNRTLMSEAVHLSQDVYCVQFASIPDFLIRMQAAKFIPHTNMERYPSIAEKLKSKDQVL
ncbi:MAG: DUF4445 domain-containing protein [Clostridia bacterium]|nr:DUF4445 domain-containing protein [Clostridia bacterium]